MALEGSGQPRGRQKRRRKVRRAGIRIDMTPMVDIAFLLLTFFMLTTAFRRPQTMEIGIPEPETQSGKVRIEESNILEVRVDANNRIFWNQGLAAPQRIDLSSLQEIFRAKSLSNIDRGTGQKIKERYKLIILIKISEKAAYENMIDVIDELDLAVASINRQYGLESADERLAPRFAFAPYTEKDDELLGAVR